jgi:hypothetical protein
MIEIKSSKLGCLTLQTLTYKGTKLRGLLPLKKEHNKEKQTKK